MLSSSRLSGLLVCGSLVALTGCGGVVDDRGATTVARVIGDENADNSGKLKTTSSGAQGGSGVSGPSQGQQGGPADPGGGGSASALAGGQGQQGGPADPGGGGGGGALAGFGQGQQQGGPGAPGGGDFGNVSGPGQGQQQGGPGAPGGGDFSNVSGPGQGQQQGGPGAPGGSDGGALSAVFGQGQGGRRSEREEDKEPQRTPEESAERVVGLFLDALDREEYDAFEDVISARATDVMLKRLRAGKSDRSEEALRRLQAEYARSGESVVLEVMPMPDKLERRVSIGMKTRSGQGLAIAHIAVRQEGKAWRIVSIKPTAAG